MDNSMSQLNEEELCSTILLPYLKALNIPLSQVSLEQTFTVRLGHTVLDIKGNEKSKLAGRFDVLVKNSDGDNLFIIELKAPHVDLTQEDVNQGISYARLLDQIAPFVIVTNGKETRIYDAISKKQINNEQLANTDFWVNSRQLSTQEDLNIRFEALQHFLGYSSENMHLFCRIQRERGMSALKGSQNNRKFNPKTYVKREKVRAAVDSFIKSNSTAFAILGESGVGKTNELCSLAEELGEEQIVLFINATEVSESIEKSLSNEFNWGFSENIGLPEIVKRLSKLGRVLKKRVLLFIDSLDEAEAVNIERSISELASNISSANGIIKLIVSVKTSDWPRFSQLRGTISKLHLLLDKSWYSSDTDSNIDPRPFALTTFNESEKNEAIAVYSKCYKLSSFPEGAVKNYCKHPFLLRVVSELYANGKDIPINMSEERLIDTWIRKKLEQTAEPELFRLALISLAQAIYEESIDKAKKSVTFGELWRASITTIFKNSSSLETVGIFRQLESIGFITAQQDHKDVKQYSFYYGPVRDYFLARHILKLDDISSDQLSEQLPSILDNSILRSSLFWHLRRASAQQKIAVDSLIGSRAEEFINTYNEILDTLFPNLKHCLPPFTNLEIGVCFINMGDWLDYGVFPVTSDRVKKTVVLKYPMRDKRSYKEINALQAECFRGGGTNFLNEDPKTSAAKYAIEMISEAIEKGNLNESHVVTTMQEGVLAIISTNKFLHGNSQLDRHINKGLPLDLDEVYKQVQLAFGRNSYQGLWRDECITEQRKSNPNQTEFSIHHMPCERKEQYEKDLIKAVESGEVFEAPNINNDYELKAISDLIIQLSAHNKWIKEQTLPPPDINSPTDYRNKFSNYSSEKLCEFINCFYLKAIESYESIVNCNFSGITHKLDFINDLPKQVYVEVSRKDPELSSFRYAYTYNKSEECRIKVEVDPEQKLFDYKDGEFLINGVAEERYSSGSTSLSYMFSPYQGPAYNDEQASFTSRMPIRTFVYEKIKDDFKEITAEDLLVELSLKKNVALASD